jgi:hypothetical protein
VARLHFASPRGADVVIAVHELAHAELHRRIGVVTTLSRSVPRGFDEGLAVVVSDDPRYRAAGPDRCRIERSRNRRTGGTGLDLAIARQIAEAHGGTVVVESSPLGGPRLVATLPAIA